ncbi:OmpP1/FadL family transporter [Acinetobacter sp. YH12126]|uniref:OmpP1/FadL family transporter n=1 Tax=Acinetobacter sp. YH12126 TaxID=2601111 RepID=UPI0015D4355F|nr:outer membrane protein transport protein [Acinetobacter sp. YH12126]
MNLKALTSAILFASVPMTGAFAAAMDRSGQSISAFLQPGNYFEAGISVLDPNVSGVDIKGQATGDMAEDYYFPAAALKIQLNEHFSFGLIYDQPFGAEAKYNSNSVFSAKSTDSVLGALDHKTVAQFNSKATEVTGQTEVDVKTQNLSLLFGFQPNENWNFYAGPVYQTVEGKVSLRGEAYSMMSGYDANIKEEGDLGWLAGFAYQIPEIALKASLTYRSEIEHEVNATESFQSIDNFTGLSAPILNIMLGPLGAKLPKEQRDAVIAVRNALVASNSLPEGKTKVTTPQSVNLDLQSGIMENTVAFANVRWVDWSKFAIKPHEFGIKANILDSLVAGSNGIVGYTDGFNLVDYSKDQWSVNAGVGRKFNDQWAGTVMVGWDSGAGNPVSTLGPTEGYWSAGLGGQFSPTPQSFIQAGVKYFWLGDATAQSGSHSVPGNETAANVANFKDNDAIGYSLKIGYRF